MAELHYTLPAVFGDMFIVQALLDHGADPAVKVKNASHPLISLKEWKKTDLVKILERKMGHNHHGEP